MINKLIKIIIILLMLAGLCCCSFATTGESLEAFSERMNELNENYNMTSEGYIIDNSENSLTKFFKFNEKEVMLKFKYDEKNRLAEMNIVFEPEILNKSPESLIFIYDCIKSFIQNENTVESILKSTDFENSISTIKMETTSAEKDNIKMEIDTTQLGTVITIYRDI